MPMADYAMTSGALFQGEKDDSACVTMLPPSKYDKIIVCEMVKEIIRPISPGFFFPKQIPKTKY